MMAGYADIARLPQVESVVDCGKRRVEAGLAAINLNALQLDFGSGGPGP